ncbi:BglG family transcription antiterminator [Salinivibrio kushneri]|uniref:BglG family transcription antiterminator n=1 Tax=Salinivibrio kushneri TaxID=1908198 RepID=UPI000986D019|nr:PTS sugar transporter subunit IIA [Salinivibrio kushneri]OOE61644.1 transcription antiterminator BglG [Salinivibrio kushneri]
MYKLSHPRLIHLLDAVSGSPLTQDELAQRLNVSTRTIRTDVALLNNVMVNHGAHLLHQRGNGYQLNIYNPSMFERFVSMVHNTVTIPRTSKERIVQIQIMLLTAEQGIKIDQLAETWNLSRTVIQNDMAEVRVQLATFSLSVGSRPRIGMMIQGTEKAIRACLTHLIYTEQKETKQALGLIENLFPEKSQQTFSARFREILISHKLYISDSGLHWLTLYAVVTLQRLARGKALMGSDTEDAHKTLIPIASELFLVLPTTSPDNYQEIAAFAIQIQARIATNHTLLSQQSQQEASKLMNHILEYIHQHYPYDVRSDALLRRDLHRHLSQMIVRVKNYVVTVNPLLEHIKRHYPLIYSITLAAMAEWIKEKNYWLTQHEIAYLVIHIGVGIERNYDFIARSPRALLYSDAGNAITLGLEAIIRRQYPQLEVERICSLESLKDVDTSQSDILITTELINVPIESLVVDPFPTQHQLEEIGRRIFVDRTHFFLLDKYFSESNFLYVEETIEQQHLFKKVCDYMESKGLVENGYGISLQERESLVSTMMGEYIAVPHSIELFAKRSMVYTVAAPRGIEWGNGDKAHLVFFLAMSKHDYEQAMGLYDLFQLLIKNKLGKSLSQCKTFESFKERAYSELC